MSGIQEIANQLDPARSQAACARILAMLGGKAEWHSGLLEGVADALRPVHGGTGLPSYDERDDAAVEFWEKYL